MVFSYHPERYDEAMVRCTKDTMISVPKRERESNQLQRYHLARLHLVRFLAALEDASAGLPF